MSPRAFFGSFRTSGKSARRLCAGLGELAKEGLDEEEVRVAVLDEVAGVEDEAASLELVAAVAGGAVALGGVAHEDEGSLGAAVAGGAVALGGLIDDFEDDFPVPLRAAVLAAGPRAANACPSCRRRPAHMHSRGGRVGNLKILESRKKSRTKIVASPRRSWGPWVEQHLAEPLEVLPEPPCCT